MNIKALSLWQPWASLVWCGSKTYETRSWSTQYRGPLLICSAKRQRLIDFVPVLLSTPIQRGLVPIRDQFQAPFVDVDVLPYGKALCLVDLVDCIPTSHIDIKAIGDDLLFGDYHPGRFAWKLQNLRRVKEPFSITGRQGLWNVDLPDPQLLLPPTPAQP